MPLACLDTMTQSKMITGQFNLDSAVLLISADSSCISLGSWDSSKDRDSVTVMRDQSYPGRQGGLLSFINPSRRSPHVIDVVVLKE